MKGYLIINDLNNKHLSNSYNNYNGFDALGYTQVWPELKEWISKSNKKIDVENYLAGDSLQYQNIIDYYNRIREKYDFLRFLFISTLNESASPKQDNFSFIGYDYGVLIEEDYPVFFSSIANEISIIDNLSNEMFKESLNQYHLFDDIKIAEKFDRTRKEINSKDRQHGLEIAYETNCFEIVSIYLFITS